MESQSRTPSGIKKAVAAATAETKAATGGSEVSGTRCRRCRAIVEIGFIMFLFYSNLLMGEFERANSAGGKSLAAAVTDIFTATNFTIGISASLIGYAIFEFLRGKL